MSVFRFEIALGKKNGRVEVDNFGFGDIWLEVVDTSYGDEVRNGVVTLTPKQARKIAKALRKAASK